MADGPWYRFIWQRVDEVLQTWSDSLQRSLRKLRMTVAIFYMATALVVSLAVCMLIWPEHVAYFAAIAVAMLSLSLYAWGSIFAMPLKAKSITRLIDKGYPANAKELSIRLIAKKLHEESIETEELLVETALNESRKLVRRYKERTRKVDEMLDADDPEPADKPRPPPGYEDDRTPK